MQFVTDASITLSWCFEDEATPWTDSLLDLLRNGDSILAPAHWPTEVSNALLMAVRRQRIPPERPPLFWDQLALLPVEVEPPLSPNQAKVVLLLSERHGLTVYDAAYLELAVRKGLALATTDNALLRAAPSEGVVLMDRP